MNKLTVDREAKKRALDKGPKDAAGDPAFQTIEQVAQFFSETDVVAIVNKFLYQEGYGRDYHRERAEAQKLLRRAAALKRLQEEHNKPKVVAEGKINPNFVKNTEGEFLEAGEEQPLEDEGSNEQTELQERMNAAFARPKEGE